MRTILITGAAGFIGSYLTERLLAKGDAVVGLDCFNDYYDPTVKRRNLAAALTHERFTLLESDICDEAAVNDAFATHRPDVVMHLAARAGVRPSLQDPNLYHRVNVIGSQHILDSCRAHPVSHLVFASSSSVYGGITETPFREDMDISRPISPYAATKRMNELMGHVYHHVYGLKVTMLRFFTVFGPRQRPDMAIHKFVKLIEEGKPIPVFGAGDTRRDYTYIDDILDGLERTVDQPFGFEIFNLGESHTTSLAELIALVEKHTGKTANIDRQALQPGDVEITYADITKPKELLGYDPKWTVDAGISEFVKWFREEHGRTRTDTD